MSALAVAGIHNNCIIRRQDNRGEKCFLFMKMHTSLSPMLVILHNLSGGGILYFYASQTGSTSCVCDTLKNAFLSPYKLQLCERKIVCLRLLELQNSTIFDMSRSIKFGALIYFK